MAKLSPDSLANCFTLVQIEEKITFYADALHDATVEQYDKDTGQGRQKVIAAQMDKIESSLQAYLKAKEILTGEAGIIMATLDYNPKRSGENM